MNSIHFQKERASSLPDRDITVDRPDIDHDRELKAGKDHRIPGDREKEKRDTKMRDHDDIAYEHDSYWDANMQRFVQRRKRSGTDQLHQDAEENEKFGTFPSSSSHDDKTAVKSKLILSVLLFI